MGERLYDSLKDKAGKSLLKHIGIKPITWSKRANGEIFYSVELIVKEGNWLCKIFPDASAEICPLVRFEGEDGTKVHALAFKIDPQVVSISEMKASFKITRNSTIMLAIVKRTLSDLELYQFGGFASEMPLNKTYDAIVIIRDRYYKTVSEHRIKDYIREGNVVVDERNNYEL